MKRKVWILMIALCLMMSCVQTVHGTGLRLVDDAGLLTDAEKSQVAEKLDEISTRQGMDVVVVVMDSIGDKSPMEYADDFYDYNGYSSDGILLLVSTDDSDWWVSTTGYGITVVTDAGLAYIADRFVPYLSAGDYSLAFMEFAQLCDSFITQARTGDPYDSHNLPKEPFSVVVNLGIALAIGLAAAVYATGAMKKQLKSVQQQVKADDYMAAGSLHLTYSRDFHLYTHLHRTEKANSSSGSSTHTSSSGTTHGGGGGKF